MFSPQKEDFAFHFTFSMLVWSLFCCVLCYVLLNVLCTDFVRIFIKVLQLGISYAVAFIYS